VLHTYYGHATGNAESFDRAFGQALAKEGFVALVPHYAHATLVKRRISRRSPATSRQWRDGSPPDPKSEESRSAPSDFRWGPRRRYGLPHDPICR
jgi:hypothetical protein